MITGQIIKAKMSIPFVLAVLIVPALISCFNGQGRSDYFNQAEHAFASGRLNEAVHGYELFLEKEQNSEKRILAWERLLQIQLDIGGDLERGLSILRSMSVEYQDNQDKLWSVLIRMGELYSRQKRFEASVEVLERSLEIAGSEKKNLISHERLAAVYSAQRDFRKARDILYQARETFLDCQDGGCGLIEYYLGRSYFHLGDLKQATHYLQNAFYSDSEQNLRVKAGMLLYDSLLILEDHQNASAVLDKLELVHPNPMVIRMRAPDIP
ncbi:tetratricopeptide repeat protein [Desulfonatronovibrio hydrogenovorans]|uniref:tetratricopeptide repeat protein n=1 Tax=Desulfonatronovibrio hydrogenovorans TaxID=53245 RepID=UPI00048EE36D|nr:tetratricopeptide repeat protein [Desulfonatronovibrio hydrogenovorans]